MDILPASIPELNVSPKPALQNDSQFNVSTDSNFEVSNKPGSTSSRKPESTSSESYVDKDPDESVSNNTESTDGNGDSEKEVVNEQELDSIMLALLDGTVAPGNINEEDTLLNAEDIETDTGDIIVNADVDSDGMNGLPVAGEDVAGDNENDAVVINKKNININLQNKMKTLEAEVDISEDNADVAGEIDIEMEQLVSDEEAGSELEISENENEAALKADLSESDLDNDTEDDIHDKTDRIRQAKVKNDSDNVMASEENENIDTSENKDASELVNNLMSENQIKSQKKPSAGQTANINVETEAVSPGTTGNTEVLTEGNRLSDSIFTDKSARSAAFTDVINKIVYVIRGNNRLGVNIEHDVLGKININMSMEKGMVHVHINASEKATSEFLENNIQYLLDELDKEGVDIGGFSFGGKDEKDDQNETFAMDGSSIKDYENNRAGSAIGSGLISVFA